MNTNEFLQANSEFVQQKDGKYPFIGAVCVTGGGWIAESNARVLLSEFDFLGEFRRGFTVWVGLTVAKLGTLTDEQREEFSEMLECMRDYVVLSSADYSELESEKFDSFMDEVLPFVLDPEDSDKARQWVAPRYQGIRESLFMEDGYITVPEDIVEDYIGKNCEVVF